MNQSKRTIVILAGIITSIVVLFPSMARQIKGTATYISDRNMANLSFSGKNFDPATQAKLQEQLKRQFRKEYELRFTQTESVWKELEGLESDAGPAASGGAMIKVTTGGGITYKNSATRELIEKKESFSKLYLIKGDLPERKWVMTGQTKKIGNYTCSEAVYESIKERRTLSFSNEDQKTETVMDTTEVQVWFTTEIPVPHGPANYWGLPGLILEMTDGKVTYLCNKVVLNPEKFAEIKAPKKGKAISMEEYKKISEEMAQNMMKKYSTGDGSSTVIKIGN
ncbi:MAG: GLPGLI family protein [Bacteroidota bacterium]